MDLRSPLTLKTGEIGTQLGDLSFFSVNNRPTQSQSDFDQYLAKHGTYLI